jgi:hypothetical protein
METPVYCITEAVLWPSVTDNNRINYVPKVISLMVFRDERKASKHYIGLIIKQFLHVINTNGVPNEDHIVFTGGPGFPFEVMSRLREENYTWICPNPNVFTRDEINGMKYYGAYDFGLGHETSEIRYRKITMSD